MTIRTTTKKATTTKNGPARICSSDNGRSSGGYCNGGETGSIPRGGPRRTGGLDHDPNTCVGLWPRLCAGRQRHQRNWLRGQEPLLLPPPHHTSTTHHPTPTTTPPSPRPVDPLTHHHKSKYHLLTNLPSKYYPIHLPWSQTSDCTLTATTAKNHLKLHKLIPPHLTKPTAASTWPHSPQC